MFWASTPFDLWYAISGHKEANSPRKGASPPTLERIEELESMYPDYQRGNA